MRANFYYSILPNRFWEKVVPHPTGCWLWTAEVAKDGYAKFQYKDKKRLAHRVALSDYLNRDLLDRECALHECDVRHCVRYDHLWVGTNRENTQDMVEKGRHYQREVGGSGYRGVYFHKASGKWAAQLSLEGARKYLGLHKTPELAYAAYLKAKGELNG